VTAKRGNRNLRGGQADQIRLCQLKLEIAGVNEENNVKRIDTIAEDRQDGERSATERVLSFRSAPPGEVHRICGQSTGKAYEKPKASRLGR